MKIKLSFVTNSSSSAFVVAFPKRIKFLDDVKKYIEDKKAETVFHDAIRQRPFIAKPTGKKVLKKVTAKLNSGYYPTAPDWLDDFEAFKKEYSVTTAEVYKTFLGEFNEKFEKKCDKVLGPVAKKFLTKAEGQYIYFFEYGDEDGLYFSELEHGNTFKLLNHLIISKH